MGDNSILKFSFIKPKEPL